MSERIADLSRALSRAGLAVAGAGLVAMTLIISWQVFARYVLHASPSWSEQAALLLMNWFILIAAAVGVRERFHIRILAGVEALANPLRSLVENLAHVVVGITGVAMVVWGAFLVGLTWEHTIPALGLPRGVGYIPLPISGALIVFFTVEHMAARAQGREVTPLWS